LHADWSVRVQQLAAPRARAKQYLASMNAFSNANCQQQRCCGRPALTFNVTAGASDAKGAGTHITRGSGVQPHWGVRAANACGDGDVCCECVMGLIATQPGCIDVNIEGRELFLSLFLQYQSFLSVFLQLVLCCVVCAQHRSNAAFSQHCGCWPQLATEWTATYTLLQCM